MNEEGIIDNLWLILFMQIFIIEYSVNMLDITLQLYLSSLVSIRLQTI